MPTLELKVTRISGGSSGQLIEFNLVGADAETLALKVQKAAGSPKVELFIKSPDHDFEEGDTFELSLTGTTGKGTQAAVPVNSPVGAGSTLAVPQTGKALTPLEQAEAKLAIDAAALTDLKNQA